MVYGIITAYSLPEGRAVSPKPPHQHTARSENAPYRLLGGISPISFYEQNKP
jgi:hypothetical protein